MNNLDQPLGAANLMGLVFLGLALLWTVKLYYGGKRGERDWLRRLLNMAGAIMALGGAAGLLVSMAGGPSLWLLAAGAIVMLMAVGRFRASERRALLSMLATSSEKGIPLPVAVRAFADRRDDEMGDRFLHMASLLEAGVTLPWALERSGNRVSAEIRAAVDLGEQSGALGPAVRKTLAGIEESELALRRVFEKYFYVAVVLATASLVLTFIVLKIAPTIEQMLTEFGIEVPAAAAVFFRAGELAVEVQWLTGPVILASWMLLAVMVLYYIGWLPTDVVLVDRLTSTPDRTAVLRLLALAVRGRRSMAEAVRVLSCRYPKRLLRKRLEKASRKIDAGGDWKAALAEAKVITPAEQAVFSSSERIGNLAWALEEMADAAQRRFVYRMRAYLAIGSPIVLGLFGLVVLMTALGLFLPLIAIINNLR